MVFISSLQLPVSSLQLQLLNRGSWGPPLLGASFLYRILSPTRLIFNCSNFLCTKLYNSSTPTYFLWASQIALIQPVHGQGYILIFLDRMHLLLTQVHFLFWQLGWGQYTTLGRLRITMLFIIFTNPSARTGYDTRSILKRSLTGLNSEFSFS